MKCRCGCGWDLLPDGPSEWFRWEECQRRWQERTARSIRARRFRARMALIRTIMRSS